MWLLQLSFVAATFALKADQASEQSDRVSLAEKMLQAMQSRLDDALSRSQADMQERQDSDSKASVLTKQIADLSAELQAEEDKNKKWHEVADNLQDQVEAATAGTARAEASRDLALKQSKRAERALASAGGPPTARAALERKTSQLRGQVAAARASDSADSSALERENGRLKEVAEKADSDAQAASAERASMGHDLKAKLGDLDAAEDTIATLQAKVSALSARLAVEKRARESTGNVAAHLQAHQQQVQEELIQAHQALQVKSQEMANTTLVRSAAEARARDAEETAVSARREMVARLKQIATLQDQATTLQDANANLTRAARAAAFATQRARRDAHAHEAVLEHDLAQAHEQAAAATSATAVTEQQREAASKAQRAAEAQTRQATDLAGVEHSKALTLAADARDAREDAEAARQADAKAEAAARSLRGRVKDLSEEAGFRDHAQASLQAMFEKANHSLAESREQLAALSKRGVALEQLSSREQARGSTAEKALEHERAEEADLRSKLRDAQHDDSQLVDAAEKMKQRLRQSEASENEYFDSMTSLQTQKEDDDAALKQAQSDLAGTKKRTEELENTNEFLRGEKKSSEGATEAAMSDYLKEIEQMKMDQEQLLIKNRAKDTKVEQLQEGVAQLWKTLTPAQRKALEAKRKHTH